MRFIENLGSIKLDTKNRMSEMYQTFGRYCRIESQIDQLIDCYKIIKSYDKGLEFLQIYYTGDSSKVFELYRACD